jgi:hypothetical protein
MQSRKIVAFTPLGSMWFVIEEFQNRIGVGDIRLIAPATMWTLPVVYARKPRFKPDLAQVFMAKPKPVPETVSTVAGTPSPTAETGAGAAICLMDPPTRLIGRMPFHATLTDGQRYDCGAKFRSSRRTSRSARRGPTSPRVCVPKSGRHFYA